MDRDRCARISSIVAVPALLFLIDWLSQTYQSKDTAFLLVPPLAVIIFLIFSQPESQHTTFRSIVILPIIGSAVGELCFLYFGLTPLGVAVATLAVLLAQSALRASMPPALALAVLAMLLRAQGVGYTIGVALATLLVWIVFLAWRKVLWERLPAGSPSTG